MWCLQPGGDPREKLWREKPQQGASAAPAHTCLGPRVFPHLLPDTGSLSAAHLFDFPQGAEPLSAESGKRSRVTWGSRRTTPHPQPLGRVPSLDPSSAATPVGWVPQVQPSGGGTVSTRRPHILKIVVWRSTFHAAFHKEFSHQANGRALSSAGEVHTGILPNQPPAACCTVWLFSLPGATPRHQSWPYLHSWVLGARNSRTLPSVRLSPRQLSLWAPSGRRGRSQISLPSRMASQLVPREMPSSAGELASGQTSRLPSTKRSRNFSFHCLKRKPPAKDHRGQGGQLREACERTSTCRVHTAQ